MSVVLEGVLIGLFLMLFVGPSFFFLIKVSMQQGFLKAGAFALGIILSDLLMLVLIYFGLSAFFRSLLFQQLFSFLAGSVILGIGLYSVFIPKKGERKINVGEVKQWPVYLYLINGFSINIMNPFTFGIWISVLGKVAGRGYTHDEYILLFAGVLSTVFCVDLLKAWFAHRLSRLLTPRVLKRINLALGIIFMLLGARLLYEGYCLVTDATSAFKDLGL